MKKNKNSMDQLLVASFGIMAQILAVVGASFVLQIIYNLVFPLYFALPVLSMPQVFLAVIIVWGILLIYKRKK